MKISQLLMFVVFAGLVFLAFTTVADNLNSDYSPKINGSLINTSLWDDKYNYTDQVNSSVSPVLENLKDVADSDKGWFTKLASGLIAIPQAFIAFVTLSVQGISFSGSILSNFGTVLGIPQAFVIAVIVVIVILVVTQLLNFFNKAGEA